MKSAFTILAIVSAAVGLLMPVLWVASAIFTVLAIGAAPAGYRKDGKRKTGGILGPLWDAAFDKGEQ